MVREITTDVKVRHCKPPDPEWDILGPVRVVVLVLFLVFPVPKSDFVDSMVALDTESNEVCWVCFQVSSLTISNRNDVVCVESDALVSTDETRKTVSSKNE